MIKDGSDSVKLAKETTGNAVTPKDAIIAGGIALRAMAKDGKFSNGNAANDIATEVKNTAISAVNKSLNTLTIAIRKTVDDGLQVVKEAMKFDTKSEKTVSSSDEK